jgi:hypothetical protein
MTTRFRPA